MSTAEALLRHPVPGQHREEVQRTKVKIFFGYLGGRNLTGWPHTIQPGKPNCRGLEALPHQ
jgi:hypothetical protein